MERQLRAQFEGLLDEPADRANGGAAERLRARFAADVAEALENAGGASGATAAGEDDAEALARAAAYLDGRLAGSERAAFLTALAANTRRRADLASAAALLGAIEAETRSAPPQLLARAVSAFAPRAARAAHAKSARPIFGWRNRAFRWSLATLALLVFVPGALVLLGDGPDWPFRSQPPSISLDAQGPPRLDQSLPAAPPTDSFKSKADAPVRSREPADMARSAPEPSSCETAPAPRADERATAVPAETAEPPSSRTTHCPPSVGAAGGARSLDAREHDSEHGAAASSRGVLPAPSATSPAAR